jgi:hypothetical protein
MKRTQGLSRAKALKELGVQPGTYAGWKFRMKHQRKTKGRPKVIRQTDAAPAMQTLQVPVTNGNLFVFYGDPQAVVQAVRGLT